MRTDPITVMLLCHVAVPAKHLQIRRESLFDDPTPPIARVDVFAVPLAVIVDVIEGQKWHSRFAATCTLSPIVRQHKNTPRLIVFGYTFSPSLFIFGMIEPLFSSFCAAFASSFNSARLPAPAKAGHITSLFPRSSFSLATLTLSRAVSRKLFTARAASTFRLTHSPPFAPVFLGALSHLRQRIKRVESAHQCQDWFPLTSKPAYRPGLSGCAPGTEDDSAEKKRKQTMTQTKNLSTRTLLFPLGQCVATPGAMAALEKHAAFPIVFLRRHQTGDWGNLGAEDKARNDAALVDESRIFKIGRAHV